MKGSKLGDFEIYWLNGGEFELDGGTMFGVVPKALWAKKYPVDESNPLALEENYIKLLNYPLLIKTPDFLVLVETGLGNKLTDKQKQIFRVTKDWDLPGDLKKIWAHKPGHRLCHPDSLRLRSCRRNCHD